MAPKSPRAKARCAAPGWSPDQAAQRRDRQFWRPTLRAWAVSPAGLRFSSLMGNNHTPFAAPCQRTKRPRAEPCRLLEMPYGRPSLLTREVQRLPIIAGLLFAAQLVGDRLPLPRRGIQRPARGLLSHYRGEDGEAAQGRRGGRLANGSVRPGRVRVVPQGQLILRGLAHGLRVGDVKMGGRWGRTTEPAQLTLRFGRFPPVLGPHLPAGIGKQKKWGTAASGVILFRMPRPVRKELTNRPFPF